jgi:hypothetical protein
MKFRTGLHPEHWHAGAWILLAVLIALALALSYRATGGVAHAQPGGEQRPPEEAETSGPPEPVDGDHYVAEVVDSLFFVQPAGFFALDLPRDPAGARAVHLSGSIAVRGKGKDIQLRLFRSRDYDLWLHPKGGQKGGPLWTSKKVRSLALDLPLPEGGPFVLLLDNGYSIRTPKHVSCQLQIQYRRGEGAAPGEAAPVEAPPGRPTASPSDEENPVTPRSNTEDNVPPPPPPPPGN